jgi:hypothetical protein
VRPWLWLLGGVFFSLVGLVMALVSLAAIREPDDISNLPPCGADLKASCLVERSATVTGRGYVRFGWISGERKWRLSVPQGLPARPSRTVDAIRVQRQTGDDELHTGADVRLEYFHLRPAIVRLPGGTDLQTEDHPNRYAPTMGYAGVLALGLGVFAFGRGWRSGRDGSLWHRSPAQDGPIAPAAPLFLAGGLAFVTQMLAGSHRLPGLVAFGAGAILGVVAALRADGRLRR